MAIFKGAGVAIVTPMNEDLSVNYDKFAEIIDEQIANGTDAIIVCGTTGEAATLSHEEHLDCIRFAVKHVNKRVPVIAGTGSNCTETAIYLSTEAEKAGATIRQLKKALLSILQILQILLRFLVSYTTFQAERAVIFYQRQPLRLLNSAVTLLQLRKQAVIFHRLLNLRLYQRADWTFTQVMTTRFFLFFHLAVSVLFRFFQMLHQSRHMIWLWNS